MIKPVLPFRPTAPTISQPTTKNSPTIYYVIKDLGEIKLISEYEMNGIHVSLQSDVNLSNLLALCKTHKLNPDFITIKYLRDRYLSIFYQEPLDAKTIEENVSACELKNEQAMIKYQNAMKKFEVEMEDYRLKQAEYDLWMAKKAIQEAKKDIKQRNKAVGKTST